MTLATRTILGNNSGPMPRVPKIVIMHTLILRAYAPASAGPLGTTQL